MYYLIYKITNLINNKIYVGKHKTNNVNDNYMGSGTLLKKAIEKYGIENFKKEILFECKSEEEMTNLEIKIVNEDFVNRKDTYNITLGGIGSWYRANSLHFNGNNQFIRNKSPKEIENMRKIAVAHCKETKLKRSKNEEYVKQCRENMSKGLKKAWTIKKHPWIGRKHSLETRIKMSNTSKKIRIGENNPNYGKMWIYNLDLKISKSIKKEELDLYLNQGWFKGRKLKFN